MISMISKTRKTRKRNSISRRRLRREVEEYIAEHLGLNDDDRIVLSGMTDDQLIEIMESFKKKPKTEIFPILML